MKKLRGYLIISSILLWTTSFVFAETNPATTSDIFEWAIDRGMISESWKDIVDAKLTREEAAPIIIRYISEVARKDYREWSCNATDIHTADSLYQEDLRKLCAYWIMHWYGNKLHPKRSLTNQQAVALIMRIADGPQKETTKRKWWSTYFERAKILWYNAIWLFQNKDTEIITLENFLAFLYSTDNPYDEIITSKSTATNTSTTTNKTNKTTWTSWNDILVRLMEIIQE